MMQTYTTAAQVVQREHALMRANRVRIGRREIKEQLADRSLDLCDLILDPPDICLTAEIGEVLAWLPGIGHWRVGRILSAGQNAPGVGRTVKIEDLSLATRHRIVARLELYGPPRMFT